MIEAEEIREVTQTDNAPEKLWEHPNFKSTKMWEFLQIVNKKYNSNLKTYMDLHSWSVENIASFWEEVLDFVGVITSKPHTKVS